LELIEIAILFIGAKISGILFNKIGQPSVGGEVLAGVILGSVLGFVTNTAEIEVVSQLGLIFLILSTTMQINFNKINESGEKLLISQILSLVIQFILLMTAMFLFKINFYFILLIMAGTFGTSINFALRTLFSLKLLGSKEGETIVGLEIVSDIIELVLISSVLGVVESNEINPVPVIEITLMFIGIFMITSRLGYRFINFVTNEVQKFKIEGILLALTLMMVFLSIGFTEALGISSFFGIMLVGLLMSRTQQAPMILEKFKLLGENLFIPIFFASLGLGVSLVPIIGSINLVIFLLVSLIVIRMIMFSVPQKILKYSTIESIKIGSAMLPLSSYGLFIMSLGVQHGLIDNVFYSVFVVVYLILNIFSPLITTFFFKFKEPKHKIKWKGNSLVNRFTKKKDKNTTL